GPLLRGLGAGHVDLVGPFGERRQQRHAVGQDLGEAAGDRQIRPLLSLAVPQLANSQGGQQRRVSGQDAEIPFGAWNLDLVDLLADDEPLGGHDLKFKHSLTRAGNRDQGSGIRDEDRGLANDGASIPAPFPDPYSLIPTPYYPFIFSAFSTAS